MPSAKRGRNRDVPRVGASLPVGRNGRRADERRHRAARSEEPEDFPERGGLSEERFRKVDVHDVGEKYLEKQDERRREHKIGE